MKDINFLLVGCGRIAHRHAEHIKKYGKLRAVCDIKQDRANEFSRLFSVKPYYSLDEMLDNETEVDVIAICTPNGLHKEHTTKSLRKNLHVLCEKPMALNSSDCREMINEAEKFGKHLFIVKQNRFNPPVVGVKKLLDEGKLGRILQVQLNCFWNRNNEYYTESDWKGTQDMDGGILFTQFSHFIDLLYWYFGDVTQAYNFSDNYIHKDIIEFEDAGAAIVKFENKIIASINYTINSFGSNMEGSITIFGEKGTVKIGGQYLNELEYQKIDNYKISELKRGNPPNNYGEYVGSMSNHGKVYENVVDVLTNNGKIATKGYEGLKTVEIIEKIYGSNVNAIH